ncbi:choice-of-anchor D domain-containing protein [bacterium]|nr:choice-of-anchor D domain-containing protein [bacterium]
MKKRYILAGLMILLMTTGLMAQFSPHQETVPLGNIHFDWPDDPSMAATTNNWYVVTLGTSPTDLTLARLETIHADTPPSHIDYYNLLTNQTYYWKLELWRDGTYIATFPTGTLAPWEFTTAGTFANVSPAHNATVGPTSTTFDWDDFGFENDGSGEDDHYHITVWIDAAGTNPGLTQELSTASSQTQINMSLIPQGTYYWDVQAEDDGVVKDKTALFTITVSGNPEMDVQGNSVSIADDDATPSTTDHTDFGSTPVSSGTLNRTYTIENTGSSDLNLNGTPIVSLGGTDAADFDVTVDPSTSVAQNTTTTFTVEFDPSAEGVRTATISIANDDADENPYNFSIQGTGQGPEIDVQWPARTTSIADGGTLASGNRNIGPDTLKIYIDNTAGGDLLNVSGLSAANQINVSGINAVTTLPLNIPAGSFDSLYVAMNIDALGAFSFDMDLANNDADEDPYDILVTGTGTQPEIDVRNKGASIADGGNYDFGSQGIHRPKEAVFFIHNIGTADLHLNLPHSITGRHADQFRIHSSSAESTVNPGASVTVTVHFHPTTEGSKVAVLNIVNDDTNESPYNINLSGEATLLSLTIMARPIGGGTTDPPPKTYLHTHNTIVPITAIPAAGYRFVQWKGHNITDKSSLSTDITVFWHNHAVAFFEPVSGPASPSLAYCYPVDSAAFVPKNARIQFRTADAGRGVDLNTLDAWIDESAILIDGQDQTGGLVKIRQELSEYSVIYTPDVLFEEDSTVTVRVYFDDLDAAPLSCDSTWSFTVGCTEVDTATASYDYVGEFGGIITNEDLGITMNIPAGALLDTLQISISKIDNLPAMPDGVQGIGLNYHFGPDGLELTEAILVAIPYTQEDLDSAGVASAADLTINYFHSASGEWTTLEVDHVDEAAQMIYVKVTQFCILTFTNTSTGVEDADNDTAQPQSFKLQQNFPNPFNPETTIHYQTAEAAMTTLNIYDISGRLVKSLVDQALPAGMHQATWKALDSKGNRVPSGVYLYQLKSGNVVIQRKMLLMK